MAHEMAASHLMISFCISMSAHMALVGGAWLLGLIYCGTPVVIDVRQGESAIALVAPPSSGANSSGGVHEMKLRRVPEEERFTPPVPEMARRVERAEARHEPVTFARSSQREPIQRVSQMNSPLSAERFQLERMSSKRTHTSSVSEGMPGAGGASSEQSTSHDGTLARRGVRSSARLAEGFVFDYPFASRLDGEEGKVTCSVLIHANGSASDIRMVRSSGYVRLDHAAISALQKARYLPARRDGAAIEERRLFTINFQLKE